MNFSEVQATAMAVLRRQRVGIDLAADHDETVVRMVQFHQAGVISQEEATRWIRTVRPWTPPNSPPVQRLEDQYGRRRQANRREETLRQRAENNRCLSEAWRMYDLYVQARDAGQDHSAYLREYIRLAAVYASGASESRGGSPPRQASTASNGPRTDLRRLPDPTPHPTVSRAEVAVERDWKTDENDAEGRDLRMPATGERGDAIAREKPLRGQSLSFRRTNKTPFYDDPPTAEVLSPAEYRQWMVRFEAEIDEFRSTEHRARKDGGPISWPAFWEQRGLPTGGE